jgi:hypothetical protein
VLWFWQRFSSFKMFRVVTFFKSLLPYIEKNKELLKNSLAQIRVVEKLDHRHSLQHFTLSATPENRCLKHQNRCRNLFATVFQAWDIRPLPIQIGDGFLLFGNPSLKPLLYIRKGNGFCTRFWQRFSTCNRT